MQLAAAIVAASVLAGCLVVPTTQETTTTTLAAPTTMDTDHACWTAHADVHQTTRKPPCRGSSLR